MNSEVLKIVTSDVDIKQRKFNSTELNTYRSLCKESTEAARKLLISEFPTKTELNTAISLLQQSLEYNKILTSNLK